MKKLFLLLLLSQTTYPMLSLVTTFLEQTIGSFANTLEDRFYLSDDDTEQSSTTFINDKAMALHFEKIKLRTQACLLSHKNNQLIKLYYFQQLKKHLDLKKQEKQKIESLQKGLNHIEKARLKIKNNAILRAIIEKKISHKKDILESRKQGFVYVMPPSSSSQDFIEI